MKTNHLIAAAASALLAAACSQDETAQLDANGGDNSRQSGETTSSAQAGPVFFFGTVRRLPESGAWVVRTAGGTQYQPTELPLEFQVDGMAVDVKAQKLDTVMTKDAPGQAIDIVEIRRRGGQPLEAPPEPRDSPPVLDENPPDPAEDPPSGG